MLAASYLKEIRTPNVFKRKASQIPFCAAPPLFTYGSQLMAQSLSHPPPLELRDLKAFSLLGRGAKGVVFLVRAASPSSELLALKAVSRSSIEKKSGNGGGDAYRRVWHERDVLMVLRHPLLPSLRGVVSTDKIVGFAIDRCSGGDLASLRLRQSEKMFSDDVIRFYAVELVLALEYLHGLGIVYRDLKPENVLIQDNGHIMLVDFDLSTKLPPRSPPEPLKPKPTAALHRAETLPAAGKKKEDAKKKTKKKQKAPRLLGCFSVNSGVSPEITETHPTKAIEKPPSSSSGSSGGKSNSFVGTEEYVAPEIIEGRGHDFAVDWWGLGVVLYEMLYGRTPFRGQDRRETFYRILTKEPELTGERTPLRDLIRKLLEKDPERRIGCEGIKAHEFFRGVEWEAVLRVTRPPFIPAPSDQWGDVEGLDVELTVEEVSSAKEKAEDTAVTSGNLETTAANAQPVTADFTVF